MNKKEILQLIRLISTVETALATSKASIPDQIYEDLADVSEMLAGYWYGADKPQPATS